MKKLKILLGLLLVVAFSCQNVNKNKPVENEKQNAQVQEQSPSSKDTSRVNPYYKPEKVTIEGYVKDGGNVTLIFDELNIGKINPLFSVIVNEDGSFHFDVEVPEPGIYQLRFPNGNIHLFLRKGKVKIYTDISNLGDYTIEGAPESIQLAEMYSIFHKYNDQTLALQDRVKQLEKSKKRNKELVMLVDSLPIYYHEILKNKTRELVQFIERLDTSMVALMAAFYLDPDLAYDEMIKVRDKFARICPHSKFYKQYLEKLEKIVPTYPGNEAVDIVMTGPDGNTYSLSDLKGQYVLLYFWAAYSEPCREDNLILKNIYREYHPRGLSIYAVSLDEEKEPWVKAINDDGIGDWIHVSNLVGWDDEMANIYRIEGIPYYILIDKKGIIINRGFKIFDLNDILKTIFKK